MNIVVTWESKMSRAAILATCLVLLSQAALPVSAQSGKKIDTLLPLPSISQPDRLDVDGLPLRTVDLPTRELLPSTSKSQQRNVCLSSNHTTLLTIFPQSLRNVPVMGGSPQVCGIEYNGCARIYFCIRR